MKNNLLMLSLLLCIPYNLYSQDWRNAVFPWIYRVDSRCIVSFNQSTNMYFYNYEFYNRPENRGDIWIINIDISKPENTVSIDTIGLLFESKYTEQTFRRNYPKRENSVIAVGFPKVPEPALDWTVVITPQLNASYAFASDSMKITPGTYINNIVMMSKALPGIRSVTVEPSFDPADYFKKINDSSVASHHEIDSVRYGVRFKGWTVGPSAPPIDFVPTIWVDTLLSFTNRSKSYGWITAQQTSDKYINYFITTKTNLEQNNITAARTILNKVLHDINIDSSSALTSEAYALLRYNTEYLLDHLYK